MAWLQTQPQLWQGVSASQDDSDHAADQSALDVQLDEQLARQLHAELDGGFYASSTRAAQPASITEADIVHAEPFMERKSTFQVCMQQGV